MKTLKPRSWRILRVIFLGALTAAVLITAVLALRANDDAVPVWVTQEPVLLGAKLREGHPRLLMVPAAAIPEGALAPTDDFEDAPVSRFIPERSILTSGDIVGSERSNLLGTGEVLLNLSIPLTVGGDLQSGEIVDLWGQGAGCGDFYCAPELLAANTRIIQISQVDANGWSGEKQIVVSAILDETQIGGVLMAEADESLNFVLRSVADTTYPKESRGNHD